MRVLLTGGTGFFGKALLRHWMAAAIDGQPVPEMTVLSRRPDGFLTLHPEFARLPWLRFHEGDVLQPATFPQDENFTHLIHAAADSTLGALLTPLDRYRQIADGTRNMLDFAVANGIHRFLLTSSGGAYGPQPPEMERIPETYQGMPDPLDARSAYGIAKRCSEHMCVLYGKQHGLDVVIARCFAFVGRDLPLDVHFAIGNLIRDALWAEEILVKGSGMAIRSYLDQSDLARWLLALLHEGKTGEAYNVGSDQAISIRDLAYLVRDILSPGKDVRILGNQDMQLAQNRYVPDTTKARQELGLAISIPLVEAITSAAANQM